MDVAQQITALNAARKAIITCESSETLKLALNENMDQF